LILSNIEFTFVPVTDKFGEKHIQVGEQRLYTDDSFNGENRVFIHQTGAYPFTIEYVDLVKHLKGAKK
jgi:hypothetical protein